MFWITKSKFYELEAKFSALEQKFEALATGLHSVRGMLNKKLSGGKRMRDDFDDDDDVEDPHTRSKDIEEVKRLFGGDIPIELMQKYKNQ